MNITELKEAPASKAISLTSDASLLCVNHSGAHTDFWTPADVMGLQT
jgi:hypothetical protein